MVHLFWLFALGLLAGLSARGQEPTPLTQGDLAWEVYGIFQAHCVDCHGGHRAKPKGKFGHVLDLARLSGDEKFLVPGDPDASEIYLLMTDPDPDYLMPPPDSDTPPVDEADIGVVRDWILGGAGLGAAVAGPAAGGQAAETGPETDARVNPLRIAGRMHPLVVHFPIALILAALAAELLGLREAARWCLWIGALGAIGSIGSGWLFAGAEGYAPDTIFRHRWLGVATAGLTVLSAGTFERARAVPTARSLRLLARLFLLLAAGLVGLAGHTGGILVHGEGFPW